MGSDLLVNPHQLLRRARRHYFHTLYYVAVMVTIILVVSVVDLLLGRNL